MNKPIRLLSTLLLSIVVVAMTGCAASRVMISKKDLDVQTKTSTAVFIDPVAPAVRTVYMEVRSGVSEFDRKAFARFVRNQFVANDNGYRLVDDPEQASFQMLVYVLSLEKASPTAAELALNQGYTGDMAAGGALGSLIGSTRGGAYSYNSWRGASVGGAVGSLVGGAVSVAADSAVHDVTYMLVCDVSIREKAGAGVLVRKDSAITTKNSDQGTSRQTVSEAVDKKEYRTRIVTTANKANLELPEAQDRMFTKTAYAMSGFF